MKYVITHSIFIPPAIQSNIEYEVKQLESIQNGCGFSYGGQVYNNLNEAKKELLTRLELIQIDIKNSIKQIKKYKGLKNDK